MSPDSATRAQPTPESRRQARLYNAGIVGLGMALPARRVTNSELVEHLDVDAEWIVRRTGIRERRRAEAGERVSDLALQAAKRALQDAEVDAADLDMVLVATLAGDEITPSVAPIVAHALGAIDAAAADIGAACTGFITALDYATAKIEAGRADRVLVIGAEVLTRFTDPADARTGPLFGDGAGAAVLAAGQGARIGSFVLGADGGLADAILARRPAGPIEMQGHETFLNAVDRLCGCTTQVLALEQLALEDVDLFVYHQANGRILSAVADRLEVPSELVYDCVAHLGNTSAASIPLALGEAIADGGLRSDARVLIAAVGAGLVWGGTLLDWSCA